LTSRLKTAVREAVKREHMQKSSYDLFKAEKSNKREIRYLIPDELKKIDRKKTGILSQVYLLPPALELIKKY